MFGAHVPSRGKIIAIADIASGSAAVGILSVGGNSPARALAASRFALPLEERSREASIAQIGEHLTQAVTDAMKTLGGRSGSVKELFCVIRAPWSRSYTARAFSQFEKDQKITEQMIADLAKQALADQKDVDRAALFEASVVRIELNGYQTAEPEGKYARSIAVSALVSECDPDMRKTLQATLEAIFPHVAPQFRSSTRALLSALQGRSDRSVDHMIIDIGNEGTALIAIREGTVAEQQQIPEGLRTILQRVAPAGIAEETLGLIRMLERDQCSSEACDAVRGSIARVEPELVRVFGEAMSACAASRRLPNRIVLIAKPGIADWFARFFARIDFSQFTQTTQPFSVQLFTAKDLAEKIVAGQGVQLDPALAVSSALVNRQQTLR